METANINSMDRQAQLAHVSESGDFCENLDECFPPCCLGWIRSWIHCMCFPQRENLLLVLESASTKRIRERLLL